ncbi:MAG: CCA tRNA nucleotidyltransferase [Pseudomonadota bacterium]
MRLSADWLTTPGARAIHQTLTAGGHRCLFVGGCVRDTVLDWPVGDIDLATDARPERVMDLAEGMGLAVHPTGIAHGTVTVVAKDLVFEVTTFRRDVATDGRRAVVAFSDRVEDDAARRDFTLNALYAEADGEIVDPLGGLPDLLARRVRFIGDPAARIQEDYLRILRFFRFHASLGAGPIDAAGLAAVTALAPGLEQLSAERVWMEMQRLLALPRPAETLQAMQMADVLDRVLPGASCTDLAALEAAEAALGAEPAPLRRLAALGAARDHLRLSRAEARHLNLIAAAREEPRGPAVRAARFGAEVAIDAGLIEAAAGAAHPSGAWRGEIARGAAATLPVSAADLMPTLGAGPALGRALARLAERWYDSDLRATRDDLLAADTAD